MKRLLAGTLAAAASLAITASAQAAPQNFYFNCGGDTPVLNLSEPPATWSATAPADAFPASGCITPMYEVIGAEFGGEYAGEVSKMDLTFYGAISNPAYRALLGVAFNISVAVDGDVVYTGDTVDMATEAGTVPGSFKATLSLPNLHIPASDKPKAYTISVSNPYVDDQYFLARGSSDYASGVKVYAFDDLTPAEQQEYLCQDDPSQCPSEEE